MEFDSVRTQLEQLQTYQARNARGHNMYSSALGHFARYLREGAR